jgi:two-component system sensor histidine kinase/response regulator
MTEIFFENYPGVPQGSGLRRPDTRSLSAPGGFLKLLLSRSSRSAVQTILLIDDDANIRSIFGAVLRDHGYRVLEASSGSEGYALATEQLPDLILTDIAMPGGDGQTLLRNIRENPDLSDKQVVLMTGQLHAVTPRKGMEQGADDFLAKPVSIEALIKCVEARLNRAHIHGEVEDRVLAQLRASLHSTVPYGFFTPLGGIIGLIQILRSDLKNLSADEVQSILTDMDNTAHRLHRRLRNYLLLLDLPTASSDQGRLVQMLLPREIRESVLSGVKASATRTQRLKDVEVKVEDCSFAATPTDLCVMVEELVDNACNFSRRGMPVKVNLNKDGVLTVIDAGRGMAADEIKRLAAFRTTDLGRQDMGGMGLGLALVDKLAAKCGAHVALTSSEIQGTQVEISFSKTLPEG